MPNHCCNTLRITGPKKWVKEFVKAVDKCPTVEEIGDFSHFDFEDLVPVPKALRSDKPLVMSEEEHQWRVSNWGTKWSAYDTSGWQMHGGGKEATIFFLTAWSPPTSFLLQASPKFPKCVFELNYAESGECFCGYDIIQNGEAIESNQVEWNSKPGRKLRIELIGNDDE